MNALVSVESRKGELIISSESQTTDGFWVMNGYFERLKESATATDLGTAVLRCLGESESGVDVPPRLGPSAFKPVLDALGLSSYAQYMNGALSVMVEMADGRFAVTPMRNGGSRTGFVEIVELIERLSDASPTELGEAVLGGIEQAQ